MTTGHVPAPAKFLPDDQAARRQRILEAAVGLGSRRDLAGVQMSEIAGDAEVALGTLYRYFPSKTSLFTTVLQEMVERYLRQCHPGPDGIGDMLVGLSRELLRRPKLAAAMVQSTNAAYFAADPALENEDAILQDAVFRALDITEPTTDDVRRTRLLTYAWWGVLVSWQGRTLTPSQAADDIQMAARLLGPVRP